MDSYCTDRFELQDVMLKYATGIDERDFDSYRSCFCEDLEVRGFGKEIMHGVDVWLAFVKNALESYSTTQHMLGPQAAIIDGDNATTRTDLQALHVRKQPEGQIYLLWGTYKTDMVRVEGRWKIRRHDLITQLTETR